MIDLNCSTWLMEPRACKALVAGLMDAWRKSDMGDLQAFLTFEPGGKDDSPGYEIIDGVARIPIKGPLVAGTGGFIAKLFGLVNPTAVGDAVKAADADHAVESIQLDIDSPGGTVAGTPELAEVVAGAQKPTAAQVGSTAASAAYWVASQADTISAGRASKVGSIGAYSVLVDSSAKADAEGVKVHVVASDELKGAGVFGAEVTDEQVAAERDLVTKVTNMFKEDIRAARPQVSDDALVGRVWIASDALANGLIDGIDTPQQEGDSMQDNTEMVALQEAVSKLEASNAGLAAAAEALQTENATLIEQAEALQAKVAEMEADAANARGDALVAKYSMDGERRLPEHMLTDDAGNPKPLKAMAYTDPDTFEAIAQDMPQASLPTRPVGGDQAAIDDDAPDQTPEQRAADLGKAYMSENPGVVYADISRACIAAARAGKTAITKEDLQ